MWEEYKSLVKTPPEWDEIVNTVLPIRNQVAHGKSTRSDAHSAFEAFDKLIELTKALESSVNNKGS
jgi:hypothetical protein